MHLCKFSAYLADMAEVIVVGIFHYSLDSDNPEDLYVYTRAL
jgi:hypothetical protein